MTDDELLALAQSILRRETDDVSTLAKYVVDAKYSRRDKRAPVLLALAYGVIDRKDP